jgi:putative membrane protein
MASIPNVHAIPRRSTDEIAVELASRRTGMSFQRTRMSADRTLMSVIRTALSLIGFGFTIYQVFGELLDGRVLKSGTTAQHFGSALVFLGVGMLVLGISYHVAFMLELRRRREQLKSERLIRAESSVPVSLTLIVAVALLAIGVAAALGMTYDIGPLGR